MKMRARFGVLLVWLAISACDSEVEEAGAELHTEASRSSASELSAPTFRVDVGAPIDGATGSRWIENYRRATGNETFSHTIPSSTLRRVLATAGSVGISLQYGMDDAGGLHIFPSAVDSAGRILTDAPADAKRFIDQYRGAVKSHFFGVRTVARLLDGERCEAVHATPALDDTLAPQLLLSDASDDMPRSYEDASLKCPPFCPSHQDF